VLRIVFSFPVALAALLALAVYMMSSGAVGDPDIWWHLQNARHLLTYHQLPSVDTYSYTAQGQPWMNHEWLAEVPYYLAWRAWGLRGVNALFVLLLQVILLGIFYLSYKSSGNLKGSWLVSVFCLFLSVITFAPRTILFGYVYLLVLLGVLWRFREGRGGPLWLVPPLFCLWINTHGSWLLGMIVLGLVTASGAIEGTWGRVEAVRWSPQQLRQLLVTGGASLAALLVNPYGYKLVLYPFDLAFRQTLNVTYGEEWASVNFHNPRGKTVLILLVALLLAALLRGYRWRLDELALALFALYSGLNHVRFLFLIAILLAPLLAKFLDFVPAYRPEIDKPLLNAGVLVASLALMVKWFPSQAALENEVERRFPAHALGFVDSHGLAGERTFNYYGWGGYLAWKDPAVKTFIDSRTDIFEYSGFLKDYLDLTGLKEPLRVLDKHHVQWVLSPPQDPLSYFLAHTKTWRVAYNDNVAEIFVRAGPAADGAVGASGERSALGP
jgi:hypothetical protein